MPSDPFLERLAQVRTRFMAALPTRIREAYAALPDLCGDGTKGMQAVVEIYRRIHSICGIGPTIGFVATGCAARAAERVLRTAYRVGRGLTAEEIGSFTQALDDLREAARKELPFMATEEK